MSSLYNTALITLLSTAPLLCNTELITIPLIRGATAQSRYRHLLDYSTAVLNGCEHEPFTVPIGVESLPYNAVFSINQANTILTTPSCSTTNSASCQVGSSYTPPPGAAVVSTETVQYSSGDSGGTLSGNTYSKTVFVAGLSATVDLLAVSQDHAGLFNASGGCSMLYDGVIGFNANATGSWLNVYENGSPIIFSHTLCPTGGTLILNGFDATATSGVDLLSAPLGSTLSTDGYTIQVSALTVAYSSNPTTPDVSTFLIDTTVSALLLQPTTYTSLTSQLLQNSAVSSVLGSSFFDSAQPTCLTLTDAQIQSLPTLTITVQASSNSTFDLTLAPYPGYVINSTSAIGQYCNNLKSVSSNFNVIGYGVLSQYVVVYNLQQSTVGFVPTKAGSCTSSGSSSGTGSDGTMIAAPVTTAPTTAPPTTTPVVSYNLSTTTAPTVNKSSAAHMTYNLLLASFAVASLMILF